MAPMLLSRVALAAVLALACIPSSSAVSSSRSLLTTLFDDTGKAVSGPGLTVPYNFTVGDIRGTWQIDESDPRVANSSYDGVSPEQVKLLYYGRTGVLVTWVTGYAQTGEGELEPISRAGASSDVELTTPDGDVILYSGGVTTYEYNYFGFPNATNYTSGLIHRVRVNGLEPGETYLYRVGSLRQDLWSPEFNFTQPGDALDYPFTVGLVADGGQTYNSSTTYEHLLASDTDVVVWVGDLTYSDTRSSDGTYYPWLFNQTLPLTVEQLAALDPLTSLGTYQPRWDDWGRLVEPLTSSRPFLFGTGNHEVEKQSDGRTQVSYLARVPPNADESGSDSGLYYSVDVGPAHFVFLTSYVDYNETSDQYQWAVQDLAAVDRDATPWLVVTFHAPVYNSYKAHYNEAECFRVAMEPLLLQYGVDIVFAGHVHAYERSFPVYDFEVTDKGPVHITIGDGGNVEKLEAVFADLPGNCPDPMKHAAYQPGFCRINHYDGQWCATSQPAWSAFREPSFGHGVLTFVNATTAQWAWNRNQDELPVTADLVYLNRNDQYEAASFPPVARAP